MFAATYPDRVSALVWFRGVATMRWSPEYPWGATPDEHRKEAEDTRDGMGSMRFARECLMGQHPAMLATSASRPR